MRLLLAITEHVDALHADKSAMTALMAAASNGSIPIVQAILDAGADVNKRNSDGVTALMHAAAREAAVGSLPQPSTAFHRLPQPSSTLHDLP